ncbi:MAG: adenosine deaminase [Streptosporangiales bacterium]
MASGEEFIRGLPKCELHVHIEGALEAELKFGLAERNGIELSYANAQEMRDAYGFHDLPSFLKDYYEGMAVLHTEQDFYDLAWAYLTTARGQNVRYAEVFFDPQAHTARGVPFDTVIRGLRRAQLDADRLLGLRTQLIMCFLRDFQAEFAMATLLESLPHKEWIVGVGLDSDEHENPPVKFTEVFRRARAEGYLLTMHCDVDQKDTHDHIRQALEVIGVDRIDHGVNAVEDVGLTAEIVRRGVGLTTCPISNRCVTGDLKADELRRALDAGLRVTVNSDDPAYFGGYVTENLLAVNEALQLSAGQLTQLERNAVEVAWLPRARKDVLLAELDRYESANG